MSEQKEKTRFSDKLIDNVIGLFETYLNILKLEIRNGAAATFSILIIVVAGMTMVTFAMMMFSISLAWLLTDLFEINKTLSFFIVGMIYILMLILLIAMRKPLKQRLDMFMDNQIENAEKN
ncbi:phage holin family protein [Flammeovirgaceae bacterium SG7u.111]|nr:phage holin family protein [Flammeovirgaceae bacterium SG7u.132]WPO36636.1 phage holin family protein [Flammeovirgaceae bacterium SG7u.111]